MLLQLVLELFQNYIARDSTMLDTIELHAYHSTDRIVLIFYA